MADRITVVAAVVGTVCTAVVVRLFSSFSAQAAKNDIDRISIAAATIFGFNYLPSDERFFFFLETVFSSAAISKRSFAVNFCESSTSTSRLAS